MATRYIVEETLIPWLPSGATTTSFIAEDFDQMKTMVFKLLDKAKKAYGFTEEDLEDSGLGYSPQTMLDEIDGEGYWECYLKKEEPYSSWSVTWRPESDFTL